MLISFKYYWICDNFMGVYTFMVFQHPEMFACYANFASLVGWIFGKSGRYLVERPPEAQNVYYILKPADL